VSFLRDEKGSALVYTFVCLVVLSFILMGMLQTAAMAYRAARFQENRQRAFSAAESGLAIGLAAMTSGIVLERREYDVEPPSIDPTADDWLGGGSGGAPGSVSLPNGASYGVWLSAQDDTGLSTLTSRGTCGSSARAVEVTVREPRILPAQASITAAARSPGHAVHLKGATSVEGDIRIESAHLDSLKIEPPLGWGFLSFLVDLEGDLTVGKGARRADFVEKFKKYIRDERILVADDARTYPVAIAPDGLPPREGIKKKSIERITISEDGDYPFIDLDGINELRFQTGDTGDPATDDITIRVRGDFKMKGISSIKVSGQGKVTMYVDRDVKDLGISFVGGLFGSADPLKLWIYCSGKHVNLLKGVGFLPGIGMTSCMVYAPDARVTYEDFGIHHGSIVCDQFKAEGATTFEWDERWRQHNFEPEGRAPKVIPGSWRERH
jgi:hypothetical protein